MASELRGDGGERCQAVHGDLRCNLPAGHAGEHMARVYWPAEEGLGD
jgi:hypothetical protein